MSTENFILFPLLLLPALALLRSPWPPSCSRETCSAGRGDKKSEENINFSLSLCRDPIRNGAGKVGRPPRQAHREPNDLRQQSGAKLFIRMFSNLRRSALSCPLIAPPSIKILPQRTAKPFAIKETARERDDGAPSRYVKFLLIFRLNAPDKGQTLIMVMISKYNCTIVIRAEKTSNFNFHAAI